MEVVTIVCAVLGVLAAIIGLLLSKSGSSGGLASLAGQDLEIFKKTKDRGIIKILQIALFIISIILIIVSVVVHFVI